jgi:hypothetical protein
LTKNFSGWHFGLSSTKEQLFGGLEPKAIAHIIILTSDIARKHAAVIVSSEAGRRITRQHLRTGLWFFAKQP